MKNLLAISLTLFSVACTGDDIHLFDPPDTSSNSTEADTSVDMRPDDEPDATNPSDMSPPEDASTPVDADLPTFWMQLGSHDADGVFAPWESNGDLPVVAGFQGGFHTEHIVRLDPSLSSAEVADALVEVSVDDTTNTELAGGGWLFDTTQWTANAGGHESSVPPLVFGAEPEYDIEVELTGKTTLADGRTAEFSVMMTLVPVEP